MIFSGGITCHIYPIDCDQGTISILDSMWGGERKVSREFALMATEYNIVRAENMSTLEELMALVGI